ncbi:exodeoxyribonuclease VII large subunit [Hydrogenimonas sp.]
MASTLTVSQLNEQIKSLLESTFVQIMVRGEISQVTYHTSGHIYFTLKDDRSSISCVMFRSNARRLRFRLEVGEEVIASGAVTVYVPRGNYQMMVQSVEPYGAGALSVAFEQLKKRLESEGLFAAERKRPIPSAIHHIAVVTSKTGAAIEDMTRVASKRWPLVKITLIDTLVQGAGAADEIARHIAYADRLGADVLIVGRGGGSIEDLWAFNEEIVARAIAACHTPVVSAVGHETDTMISDFVADMRAPTPSAAIEQVLPDMIEVLYTLDERMQQMQRGMRQILLQKREWLKSVANQLEQHNIERKLSLQKQSLSLLHAQMIQRMRRQLAQKKPLLSQMKREMQMLLSHQLGRKQKELDALNERLKALDPKTRLLPGAVQLTKDGKITPLSKLRPKEKIQLSDGEYAADATVEKVEKI